MSLRDRLREAIAAAPAPLRLITGDLGADARMYQRISRLPTDELIRWTESAIVGVGRAFSDWQMSANPAVDSLNEARMGTAALQAVLDELDSRRTAEGWGR